MSISLGIVGFGNHLRKSLLPNIIGSDELQIVRVADLQANRRDLARSILPGIEVTPDVESLLRDDRVDAVVISADPAAHVSLSRQALNAGKHVFVEKPLGTDPSAIEELASLADGQGKALMIGTMWRHAQAHVIMSRWMTENNTFPTSLTISATFPSIMVREGWFRDARELAFWDMFIHPIDWALSQIGSVDQVVVRQVPSDDPGRIECLVTLTDIDGRIASLMLSTGSVAYQVSTWMHTSNGSLLELDTKEKLRVTTQPTWSGTEGWIRDRPTLEWQPGQLYRGWGRHGYAEEFRAFASACVSHQAGGDEARAAAVTARVIIDCLRSIENQENTASASGAS